MSQYVPSTKRHELKPAQMMRFLAEVSPCGAGEKPCQVVGWSRKGKWTRLKATYPNGWELSVHFDREERVSSWSAKMSLRAEIKIPAKGSTIAEGEEGDSA